MPEPAITHFARDNAIAQCGAAVAFPSSTRNQREVTCEKCQYLRLHHLVSKRKARGYLLIMELSDLVDLMIWERSRR